METVLCGVQDVRAITSVARTNSEFDTGVEPWIIAASSAVRTFTRAGFDYAQYTETFPTRDRFQGDPFTVGLRNLPVDLNKPIEVLYSSRGRFRDNGFEVVPDVYFEVEDATMGRLSVDITTRSARSGLRVTYWAGYPLKDANAGGTLKVLDVPDNIRTAAAIQAAYLMKKNKDNALGKTTVQSNENVQETYDRGGSTGLIREAQGLLLGIRKPLVGRT
jgi:hypothetical protein